MEERFVEGKFNVVLRLDAGNIILDNNDVVSVDFTEDIFSFCLTGKLVFIDNKGIMEKGPITGNESLVIVYGEDEDIEKEFYIYKINKIEKWAEVGQGSGHKIEMIFVDKIYYAMNLFNFSKSWKNEKISNIVKNITEHMLYITPDSWKHFEETRESLDHFYMPYWTVNTALSWLLKRGTSAEHFSPGFLYYNTIYGLNYITLEKLLQQKELLKIDNTDDGLYLFETDNLFYRNKILTWTMSSLDNSSLYNLMGGNRLGFDSKRKKFLKQTNTYDAGIKKLTVLGKKTLYNDISSVNSDFIVTGEDDEQVLDNLYYNLFSKKYSLQQVVNLTVKGHEKRIAGGMIEVFWSSHSVKDYYNSNMAGKYLIKSVTHHLGDREPPFYKQKLVCIKNGYEDSENRKLHKSEKQNLVTKKW